MANSVRIGVIGTSVFADCLHMEGLATHPRAELVAVCGRNRGRAEALAAKYSVDAVFTDYGEMIANGGLDAVVIVTPEDTHFPMAMAAIEAGLHVSCEKPLALNAREARIMLQAAEAAGIVHMVGYLHRWRPSARYMRALIDDGYLGPVFDCHALLQAGIASDGTYGWRFDSRHANGALSDVGSHMIDLLRWLVGDIARVSASVQTFVAHESAPDGESHPANDSAVLALEFSNGAHGTIHASLVAHVADDIVQEHVMLHGRDGTLEESYNLRGSDPPARFRTEVTVRGARREESLMANLPLPPRYWDGLGRGDPFDMLNKRDVGDRMWVDAILSGHSVSPNFFDGLKAQEVIDAAFESSATGQWVDLSPSESS